MTSPLRTFIHTHPLPATSHPVMAQVGWLGHRAGHVYALADQPFDTREPGGFSPLYIQIGTWREQDGRYEIRD